MYLWRSPCPQNTFAWVAVDPTAFELIGKVGTGWEHKEAYRQQSANPSPFDTSYRRNREALTSLAYIPNYLVGCD